MSAVIVCVLASSALARRAKVNLALDYTQRDDWQFVIDYKAERFVEEGGSTSSVKSQIRCDMSAKISEEYEGKRLVFLIDTVKIRSELFDKEQQDKIAKKLTGADFSLGLIAGVPVFDTLRTFEVSEISRWDFVLQFAKLLPDMPKQPVSKGYTWERSGVHPVQTSVGEVPCDIYRLYKIDSLSTGTGRAHVSWEFRYAAAQKAVMESALLKQVPISGKGKGNAVIDAKKKVLLKASMRFETPSGSHKGKKIHWVERTTLEHVENRKNAGGPR